ANRGARTTRTNGTGRRTCFWCSSRWRGGGGGRGPRAGPTKTSPGSSGGSSMSGTPGRDDGPSAGQPLPAPPRGLVRGVRASGGAAAAGEAGVALPAQARLVAARGRDGVERLGAAVPGPPTPPGPGKASPRRGGVGAGAERRGGEGRGAVQHRRGAGQAQ